MPTQMPHDQGPRLHRITIYLTLEEVNWITYLAEDLAEAAWRETGKEEEPLPEEEIAHLLLRGGMAAFVGLAGHLPEAMQKLLIKHELLAREEDALLFPEDGS